MIRPPELRPPDLAAVRIIIYDCDGVLIDSRRANAAFYNHILGKFSLAPLTPRQLDFVQASTAREAIDFLFAGDPRREEAQDYQRRLDNTPFLALLRPEPHVREVLAALRPAYHTAVATNRGKSLPLVLKELALEGLFDLTVSSYDVTRPKPDPECLEKILEHFQLRATQAVYIGDSPVDGQVSRRAGVVFGAYRNQNLQADFHLRDHRDLLGILSGIA